MIRMVNSGTEACMSALRLARGFTGKNKFIKFEGCYHGHADSFLVKAGSGVATQGIQEVPGITATTAADTLICQYNNLENVQQVVAENKGEMAAIILEPVGGNMGCILPQSDFLSGLRKLCDSENILLIFDEVMTGFRLAAGGAQELYGVEADLVTYGKIIGAGLPVGAYGGRKEIMQHIAPLGKVYQAGTLSGNPLAMAAGYALLTELNENRDIYSSLESTTLKLNVGLTNAFSNAKIAHQINHVGSMISVHFSDAPVTNFDTAAAADNEQFKKYFHYCLESGVYLPPSPFETWFISSSIAQMEIDKIIAVTEKFVNQL